MNLKSPLVWALVVAARCFGAAPDSLAGFVYYESGGTIAHTGYSFAVALNSAGTFQRLYGSPPGSPAEDGTWSYRKTDGTSGELTLSYGNASSTLPNKVTLVFTRDTEGYILGSTLPSGILGASFRVASPAVRPPMVNCSNRSFVRAGGTAFTGFVIAGDSNRTVLVRAIGPGLAPFGITDALRNPTLTVVRATDNRVEGANDDWSSDLSVPTATGRADAISRTSALVGAFPLTANSKDAAVILTLAPGAYIAQTSSADTTDSGQALIEVYLLP